MVMLAKGNRSKMVFRPARSMEGFILGALEVQLPDLPKIA